MSLAIFVGLRSRYACTVDPKYQQMRAYMDPQYVPWCCGMIGFADRPGRSNVQVRP